VKYNLEEFLEHLNNILENIKFTVEVEVDGKLAFLYVVISKKGYGTLEDRVYRKNTHTNRYLHANSHHHFSQYIRFINTQTTREIRISNIEHIEQETYHLKKIHSKRIVRKKIK
jgi:hypothetical protein